MLQCLREASAQFLIVGAHALAAHGLPRATGDLDVLVRPDAANASRVFRALAAFGAPLEAHGVSASDFTTPGTIYQIGLPPRRIDILTEISGVSFDDAWSSRIELPVLGEPLAFLGREALIANKRAAGRPKDLADVLALEAPGDDEPSAR
ncbi:MAG: hypothetical protein F9K40_15090 [Kofleriaceae bacterium]|nr:MAG: hypothetical protein F9K40_15090 [Kofleriaceae bacterium]MBZ0235640.1 hypothetical protein [Kofleriaceae bacterium]